MTIANADKFIKAAMTDVELRAELNRADSQTQRDAVLLKHEMSHTFPEFDEAFNHLLAEAQFAERAEALNQLRIWWEMLLQS